ncbi:DUF4259 domain-containing protein [Kitasatospora sp. NPDC048540]|uniref:DUF4259 domain-containing protein n=1 Tax=Kitasatospora sp. NPDC048540 TaxID=3155634 RepID=UPI0033C83AAD
MGVWDINPYGNDTAAEFAASLDRAGAHERESIVREALERAAGCAEHLEEDDGERAVAAAALLVAQLPGGEPVNTVHGPAGPLPVFPAGLRPLAIAALDRVTAGRSELAERWSDQADGPRWQQEIKFLRDVLGSVPPQTPTGT